MANHDGETDGDLNPPTPTIDEILAMSPTQLDRYRLAALAQIAFDFRVPAAARVAALKELKPGTGEPGTGDQNPGNLSLDEINSELERLTG